MESTTTTRPTRTRVRRRLALAAACGIVLQFATCTAIVQEALITGYLNATTNVLAGPIAEAAQNAANTPP